MCPSERKTCVRIHSRRHTKNRTNGFFNVPLQRHKHYNIIRVPLNCAIHTYIRVFFHFNIIFIYSKQLRNGVGGGGAAGRLDGKRDRARRVASLDEYNIL